MQNVQGITDEVSEKFTSEFKKTFSIILKEYKICPSEHESLKEIIYNTLIRSMAIPGEVYGLSTAEAIGRPITQMTLKAFHKTGAAEVGHSGLSTFRELLFASKVRAHEMMYIHFKNYNLSFDQIIRYRNKFAGISVQFLVVFAFIDKDGLKRYIPSDLSFLLCMGESSYVEENFITEDEIIRMSDKYKNMVPDEKNSCSC